MGDKLKKPLKIELGALFNIDKAADGVTDDSPVKIVGYANTVVKDRYGDVIPVEAWTKGALDNYLKNPVVLAFHNYSRPIGKTTDLTLDAVGLKVTAEISPAAGDVYKLVKDGTIRAFSIGAAVKDMAYDRESDTFVIKELELYEISVVSVPANQDSIFEVSKSFESPEAYEAFKKSFAPEEDPTKGPGDTHGGATNKELDMDKDELAQLIATAVKSAMPSTEPSGTDKLLAELTARVEAQVATDKANFEEVVKGLRAEISEKSAELDAAIKSKMQFQEPTTKSEVSVADQTTAVILAKALSKGVTQTDFAKKLMEKAGPHQSPTNGDDWERTVSTNMLEDIRRRLVVAPLFRSITMNTPVVRFPINPEAGYANWVGATDYGTTASSGTAQTHALSEVTLTSYKLATKEFLTNEEDEDSIILLAPIIRDAIVRRMAKAHDKALLRGQASGVADPLNGVAKVGDTVGTSVTLAVASAASVDNLVALRRKLGVWGLDPSDLIYVVSTEVYYDLLEDTKFQTVDKIGDKATLLTGQIGMVGGVPVVVSGEFEVKAATKYGAICLNKSNFLVGEQRGMRLESEYSVEKQNRILVATRRLAFQQITTANGSGVATFKWVA